MAKSIRVTGKKIILPVSFETPPDEDIPLQAFLFSRSGELLEKSNVQKGQVEFKTADRNLNEVRVFIAPSAEKRSEDINTLADVERLKAYETVLNLDARGTLTVLPIPSYLSKLWHLRKCRIRGRVIKNFSIGNIYQDRGICHARVHICEVDRIRWLIEKIPDEIIIKIPELITEFEWPIPIPDPGPKVFSNFDLPPRPFREDLPDRSLPAFNAISESAKITESSIVGKSSNEMRMKTISNEESPNALPAVQLSEDIKNQLLSKNLVTIRNTLVENAQLFHPWFCYVPWLWPYFYRCDEIKVFYTDANGNFDTEYWYWWTGDQPDLYFWVEYFINGVWTTVYKPPIPCYTYWNYTCGSFITIRVTDPRVRWECHNVIDGDIVWVKTIGSSASVVHIQPTDLMTVVQGKNFNRIGLSDVSVWGSSNAVGDYRRPFGSTLGFIIQFGSGLPSNGMYYYRWSYRKIRHADLSPAAISAPVSLHGGQVLPKSYSFEYFDAAMHKHIDYNAFKLGPVSKNGNDDLYIIPPAYPTSAPVNATEMSPLWNQDTLSVSFDSTKLSNGLYEFYLELFDFAGNKLSGIPRQLFQVPHYNTFAPSVDAPNENIMPNGANADAFKMVARIDNSKCQANIFKIKVNGSEVSTDCCGFVPYPPNANIEVAFRAYHPQNLATFGFTIQKGTCHDAAQSALTNASGMVIGNAGVYSRNASSIYRHTFTPAQLLSICTSGGKAAFAELLNLHALATNGSNQLYFLNDSALAAFALEPA